jgi:hypothetical protein
MKVFGCKRKDSFSGGLIIVAANNLNEAFETFAKDKRFDYMIEWYDFETGQIAEDISKVDSDYYRREDWFEIPNLVANVGKPCVIEEGGYSE